MMFSESILFFLEMEKDDLPPVNEDIVDEGGGLQVACFYCMARQCLQLRQKAKIYGVLYKHSCSIAFDETSSHWSEPKTS